MRLWRKKAKLIPAGGSCNLNFLARGSFAGTTKGWAKVK